MLEAIRDGAQRRNVVVVALVVAALLGVGALAWARSGDDDPGGDRDARVGSERSDGERADRARSGRGRGGRSQARPLAGRFLQRGVYGDLVVTEGDGFRAIGFVKGTITAVDVAAGTVTIVRPDTDAPVTKKVVQTTRFLGGVGSVDRLTTGQPGVVVFSGDDAVAVGQRRRADREQDGGNAPAP